MKTEVLADRREAKPKSDPRPGRLTIQVETVDLLPCDASVGFLRELEDAARDAEKEKR